MKCQLLYLYVEILMFFSVLICHEYISFCELSEHVSDDLTMMP